MPLYIPSHTPSWKQGFARSRAESDCPGLWKGLIGAWLPALGPTGSVLRDISIAKNNGDLADMDPSSNWVLGDRLAGGHALDFDGDNDYVDLGSLPVGHKLNILTGELTVAFSFRAATGAPDTFQRIFSHSDGGGGANGWDVVIGAGGSYARAVLLYVTNLAVRSNSYVYTEGEWCQVVVRYSRPSASGAEGSIWVNGKDETYQVYNYSFSDNALDARIGTWCHDTGREFKGQLAHLMIWDRCLAPSEVLQVSEDPLALVTPRDKIFPVAVAGSSAISSSSGITLAASGDIAASGRLSGSTALGCAAFATAQASGKQSGATSIAFAANGNLSFTAVAQEPFRVAAGIVYVPGAVAGQVYIDGAVAGMVA